MSLADMSAAICAVTNTARLSLQHRCQHLSGNATCGVVAQHSADVQTAVELGPQIPRAGFGADSR